MKKPNKMLIVLLISYLASCALNKSSKINNEIYTDDLNSSLQDSDSLMFYSNAAYRLNPNYTNDLIIALIRQNTLSVKSSKPYVAALIDMLSIQNKNEFNIDSIRGKLNSEQLAIFNKVFANGTTHAKTIKEYENENEILSRDSICYPEDVDMHWAEFSATGDRRIISKIIEPSRIISERLRKEGSVVVKCCIDCVDWSVKSQAIYNKDVYDYLVHLQDSLDPINKREYKNLIPDSAEVYWMNYYREKDLKK